MAANGLSSARYDVLYNGVETISGTLSRCHECFVYFWVCVFYRTVPCTSADDPQVLLVFSIRCYSSSLLSVTDDPKRFIPNGSKSSVT